jgi:hypothetical protein
MTMAKKMMKLFEKGSADKMKDGKKGAPKEGGKKDMKADKKAFPAFMKKK